MKGKLRAALAALYRYLLFFLLMAFVITCCMLLFFNALAARMDLVLTEENVSMAAKLTFGNVMLLSLACTVIDSIRRKITVDRPVRQITEGAQRIMRGDFTVRLRPIPSPVGENRFNEIIACFNKMAEELAGTETLRTDFIANVSHELKTPLAVMQNYASMLQQPGLPEEERMEYAGAIDAASRRLADLISNILRLNKLENQQIFPQTQVCDLSEQLCQCLLGFEELWERKGIEIEADIQPGVLVRTDSEMMSLVWNNLFSNALKFTEPGGRVTLRLRTEGELAVVEVSDTGCGISPETGKRIFDKFYQGDTSHATQGNGLGLALVKRIIDITGSEISVTSQVGAGSTFTVKLRREPDEQGPEDAA